MFELILLVVEAYLRVIADDRLRIDQLLGNLQVLSTDLSLLLQPFLRLET